MSLRIYCRETTKQWGETWHLPTSTPKHPNIHLTWRSTRSFWVKPIVWDLLLALYICCKTREESHSTQTHPTPQPNKIGFSSWTKRCQEDVSEWYTIFVLTFQASMGFSVVKVIMGVFLQNTFSVAANDDVKLGMSRLRDIDVMLW